MNPVSVSSHKGERLDIFLVKALGYSRNQVQLMIKQRRVVLAPQSQRLEPSYRLKEGDEIWVEEKGETAPVFSLKPQEIPFGVLFEDKNLLVIDKPAGVVVHPAVGHAEGTLVHGLLHHCGEELSSRSGLERLGIVHRLDKETSGLLVVAKTNQAHEHLSFQFQQREVQKNYLALTKGLWSPSKITCQEPIARHPMHRKKMGVPRRKDQGRSAHTDFVVEQSWGQVSLVRCYLYTGRTHQIRVHAAYLGHPILGDTLYGRSLDITGVPRPSRQLLHACLLGFIHPVSRKKLVFEAPLPEDFQQVLTALERVQKA